MYKSTTTPSSADTIIHPLWHDFTYFNHQLVGIKWMLEKEIEGTVVPGRKNTDAAAHVYGGFQCDDMGLGKTIQVASVIVNNPHKATLLIVPLAVIDTWAGVLQRSGCAVYQPDTGSGTGAGTSSWKRMADFPIPMRFIKMRPTVYISNYEKLYHNPSLFRREWDRVVLDEAHKIRNGDSESARACRKIVAPIRWVVTGTPLVNSLTDVVSLLGFLGVPHSKLWRWEPRYVRIIPDLLIHRSLDSLRKTIKDAPPLPKIKHLVLPFTTRAEEDFYHGVQGITDSMFKKYSADTLRGVAIFKQLLRLRQISVHPQVYINALRREKVGLGYNRPDWLEPSTKLQKIGELIGGDDTTRVHKYIVFCQFHDEMELIRDYLSRSSIVKRGNILMYSGALTQKERGEVLLKSKELTETTVMLLQLQAGGVGLNLQEYDRVIFVSPWWTSAMMDQAVARAVRMGQTAVVKVWHLRLAAENDSTIDIDAMVNDKAEEKRVLLKKLFAVCEKGGDD